MTEPIKNLAINPYLNPGYWEFEEMGSGGKPWPHAYTPVEVFEAKRVFTVLSQYLKHRGNGQDLEIVSPGEAYDTGNCSSGTVCLTMTESLIKPRGQNCVPMIDFLDSPLPDCLPGLTDKSRELHGHGYTYASTPWLNIVIKGQERPYLIKVEDVFNKKSAEIRQAEISRGLRNYVVGETYHFVSDQRETLKRVNALAVCMRGVRSQNR